MIIAISSCPRNVTLLFCWCFLLIMVTLYVTGQIWSQVNFDFDSQFPLSSSLSRQRNSGIDLQSWTKSVKNFALSYTQETHPAYLAPWWPLPPPLPGQCCLVGCKNVRATLQHCFLGGRGSILSEPGFRGKYSKIKHITCIFLNIFVQDCRLKMFNLRTN